MIVARSEEEGREERAYSSVGIKMQITTPFVHTHIDPTEPDEFKIWKYY